MGAGWSGQTDQLTLWVQVLVHTAQWVQEGLRADAELSRIRYGDGVDVVSGHLTVVVPSNLIVVVVALVIWLSAFLIGVTLGVHVYSASSNDPRGCMCIRLLLLLGPSEAGRGRDVRKRANRGVVLRKHPAAANKSS